jgi:hypothetical protein
MSSVEVILAQIHRSVRHTKDHLSFALVSLAVRDLLQGRAALTPFGSLCPSTVLPPVGVIRG